MNLITLLAELRNAKQLILSTGPSVLEHLAEVSGQVAEVARSAAAYLKGLGEEEPRAAAEAGEAEDKPKKGRKKATHAEPVEELSVKDHTAAVRELKAFKEEMNNHSFKPESALKLKATTAPGGGPTLPPNLQTSYARVLSTVAAELLDGLDK